MRFSSIPYFIVLLASVLPLLSAAVNSRLLTYLPDILAIISYFVLLISCSEKSNTIGRYYAIIMLFLAAHVCVGVITGRGIASGGMVSIFVVTFIFSKLLGNSRDVHDFSNITKQVSVVYILHVVFIFFEMMVRLSGYTDIFVMITANATEVAKYKTYNSATLLRYIGFDNMSGMNSMLLGSQIASQLTLYAVFWFAPIYRGFYFSEDRISYKFWFLFSLVMFPFVATMTATLVLVLLIMMHIYLLPNSVLYSRRVQFLVPVFVIIFSDILIKLVAFRITTDAAIDIYMEAFLAAPLGFIQLSLIDQLIGYGSDVANAPILEADFGLAMLTYQVGLLLMGVAILCMFAIVLLVVRAVKLQRHYRIVDNPWTTLAAVNMICAVGWGASLVHYTQAVELGGRHIFSFHLAICLISLSRLKNSTVISNSSHEMLKCYQDKNKMHEDNTVK